MKRVEIELCQELMGHTNSARCCIFLSNNKNGYFVASGGQDNAILLWKQESPNPSDLTTKVIHHSCWITCLLGLKNGCFASGGYDGVIRIYSCDGDVVAELVGHSAGITSLAHGMNGTILSGSWDGSARIWDLETLNEIMRVDGMENAVTAAALSDSVIVATSTGVKDATDSVSGYAVRLFSNGELVRTLHSHYASVRCCCPFFQTPGACAFGMEAAADGFLTGANDGKVIAYNRSGDVQFTCETVANSEGKYPFIMKVKALGAEGDSLWSVSVSEDSKLRLWSNDQCVSEVPHPNSLWDVDYRVREVDGRREVDLLTACSDGIVRLFSSEASCWLSLELRNKYKDVCAMNEQQLASKIGVNVDSLPAYELREQYPGARDGEVKMFRKGEKGFVFKWSVASGTWIEIGEVIGASNAKHKLPVEVETAKGVETLTLEYGDEDNAFEVAQQFIDQHQLSQDYLDEIAQYIIKNRGSSKPTIDSAPAESEYHSEVFPERHCVQYSKLNTAGVLKKLREFNAVVAEEVQKTASTAYVLSEDDFRVLRSLMESLTNQEEAVAPVNLVYVSLLQQLLTWPKSCLFPVLDVMKNVVLRPGGMAVMGDTEFFAWRAFLLSLSVEEPLTLMYTVFFRLLANALCNVNDVTAVGIIPSVLSLSKVVIILENKQMYQALAAFLLNATVFVDSLMQRGAATPAILKVFDSVVAVSCDMLLRSADEMVWERCLSALCNAIIFSPRSYQVVDADSKCVIAHNSIAAEEVRKRAEDASRLFAHMDSHRIC
ncbi:hypothetical protein AV274_4288 [Blastocystis sp. ATCC 50177/Nand II]|uniref:Phospholipase A-2-activating protein n=1 Tax=Blastocystis sp. subtype 1 (strain ATCC 50177 / NandII) TaxID=478820 RepID=A0A196SCH7_BLAHN|nr:hypothetical protein AV274_4288 [Blastocystis sp. ATCC 50177/Nand II]